MRLRRVYTSASCNGYPHVLEHVDCTLIFGSCNAIVILDTSDATRTPCVLLHHKDHVTSVRCLKRADNVDNVFPFISTSNDETACVWFSSSEHFELKGHEASVRTADLIVDVNNDYHIVTAGLDGLRQWTMDKEGKINANESLVTDDKLALDVRLVPMAKVMLIAALDDCSIHFYVQTQHVLKLKGHSDWVQSLALWPEVRTSVQELSSNESVLMASGGQDGHIRLWQVSLRQDDKDDDDELSVKPQCIEDWATCSLSSILSGHTDKVMAVCFYCNGQRLISCSMDKSVIVWARKEGESNKNEFEQLARMGEVGGNAMGFVNVVGLKSNVIVATSLHGSFHAWQQSQIHCTFKAKAIAMGGHFAPISDLVWHHSGLFLVSTSHDQTTRVHAPFRQDDSSKSECSQITWHELARPQVHGHDLYTVCMLGNRLVSGAEEKVVRVFNYTLDFVKRLRSAVKEDNSHLYEMALDDNVALYASVPSLGLSNKANSDHTDHHDDDQSFPVEETLMERSLWPELHKLYGHGNEIFNVAASNPVSSSSSSLLASSCKATKAEQASILLWDASRSFSLHQTLRGHNLTVTRMKFSPCNTFLLSVSRDRCWCLYKLDQSKENNTNEYELVCKSSDLRPSVHQRIIWDCDWSRDSKRFITCSRDKKVALWAIETHDEGLRVRCESSLTLEDSVTSVAIFPKMDEEEENELIAAGLDNGQLVLIKWSSSSLSMDVLFEEQLHHKSIRRLAFRPRVPYWQLATCSDDRMLHITDIVNTTYP